jgi:hypothetical protein
MMRWRIFLTAISLGLASCGGNDRSAEERANTADLLDEATVNAILGADVPLEGLTPANALDANSVSENASAASANSAG